MDSVRDVIEDDPRVPGSLGFMSPTLQYLVASPKMSCSIPPIVALAPPCIMVGNDTSDVSQKKMIVSESGFVSNSISPMVTPIKDPFSGRPLCLPPPLSLNLSSEFSSPQHCLSPESGDSASSSSMWSGHGSFVASPTPPGSPLKFKTSKLSSGSDAYSSDRALPTLPPAYRSLSFSVTTYRWQAIDDTVHGVPIVEIRPYNKSDGKRYVYVKVDGLEEMQQDCKESGLPLPKAKFEVERCCSSSILGILSVREAIDKKEEDGVDRKEGDDSSSETKIEEPREEKEKEIVDLSRNLTLLVSEQIVKHLDKDGIGRGSPPPEDHKLRVIVTLLFDQESKGTGAEAQSLPDSIQVASMPFFRIKRRQKRKNSIGDENDLKVTKKMKSANPRSKANKKNVMIPPPKFSGEISLLHTTGQPQQLINTAPYSQHYVDFYCNNCGVEKNVKVFEASNIIYVSPTSNEIWVTATTRNCQMQFVANRGRTMLYDIYCRMCRTNLGLYARYADIREIPALSNATIFALTSGPEYPKHEIFKFAFLHPASLTPILFYRWISEPEDFDQNMNSEMDSKRKIEQGWVGMPVLDSDFPELPGAYNSIDEVKAVHYQFPSAFPGKPETRLLDMIHSMDCDSDAAWTCRALLPKHDRCNTLAKLKPLVDQSDIRKIMSLLESGKINVVELQSLQRQLYEKVCSLLFG